MPLKNAFRENVREQMKSQLWRKAACKALDVLQEKDPKIFITMDDGEVLEIRFMDIYCQTLRDDLIHFEDLVLTGLAWQNVLNRRLIYRVVQVRESPFSDREVERNNELLRDMIEHYPDFGFVRANFWGGNQGADGTIEFKEPFIRDYSGTIVDNELSSDFKVEPVDGISKNFPLEVGYCMPDQMEFHFRTAGCVARFPYGYDFIIFFEFLRRAYRRR